MAKSRHSAAKSKACSSGTGSTATSRAGSPQSSPRAVIGTYRLEAIPGAWDNDAEVRERIRLRHNLLRAIDPISKQPSDNFVDGTRENVSLNCCALLPLATVMAQHDLAMPSIENLIWACDQFYTISKVSSDGEHCYQQAWGLRRLLVKLQSFCYREKAPEDFGF